MPKRSSPPKPKVQQAPQIYNVTSRQVRGIERDGLVTFKLYDLIMKVWSARALERETKGYERADFDEQISEHIRLGRGLRVFERALAAQLIKAVVELDAQTLQSTADAVKQLIREPLDLAITVYFHLYRSAKIEELRAFVAQRLRWPVNAKGYFIDAKGDLLPAREKKLRRHCRGLHFNLAETRPGPKGKR